MYPEYTKSMKNTVDLPKNIFFLLVIGIMLVRSKILFFISSF